MIPKSDQIKTLEDKIKDLWELHDRLRDKGPNYQYPAHVVSEIANYLIGESFDLKIAEITMQAIVEKKTIADILAAESNKK